MDVSGTILKLAEGDVRTIAKTLTLVENESEGSKELLANLPFGRKVPIIGITGPPGAGSGGCPDRGPQGNRSEFFGLRAGPESRS